jgi:hypothetical protein
MLSAPKPEKFLEQDRTNERIERQLPILKNSLMDMVLRKATRDQIESPLPNRVAARMLMLDPTTTKWKTDRVCPRCWRRRTLNALPTSIASNTESDCKLPQRRKPHVETRLPIRVMERMERDEPSSGNERIDKGPVMRTVGPRTETELPKFSALATLSVCITSSCTFSISETEEPKHAVLTMLTVLPNR